MFLQNWHLHSEKGIEGFGIEPQAGSGNGVLNFFLFSFFLFHFLVGIDHETPAIQYWDKGMLYNNMSIHQQILEREIHGFACSHLFFFI